MGKRLDRTAFNWRWWLVLPLFPAIAAVVLVKGALDNASDVCEDILDWVKGGWHG